MVVIIQMRRDSASDWTSNDPTLAEGEIGYETDTGYMKVGDGSTSWSSLDYFSGSGAVANSTLAGVMEGNISGSSYTYGFKDIDFISSQSISGGTIIGGLHYPAEYIIWTDGSSYYYKDGRNGSVYSNSDASNVFNTLLSGSKNEISIYVNSGTYHMYNTINCSGSYRLGWHLSDGALIYGHTAGYPVFDFTAGTYCTFIGGRIYGDMSDSLAPSVGMLFARSHTLVPGESYAESAGNHYIENVRFGQKFSSACVCNITSEDNVFYGCSFKNYYSSNRTHSCFKILSHNKEGLSSPHSHPSGSNGMTHFLIDGGVFTHYGKNAYSGSVIGLYGNSIGDINIKNSYLGGNNAFAKILISSTNYMGGPLVFDGIRTEGTSKYSIYANGDQNSAGKKIHGLILRDFSDVGTVGDSDGYAIYVSSTKLTSFNMEGSIEFTGADGMFVQELQHSNILAIAQQNQLNNIDCKSVYSTTFHTNVYDHINITAANRNNIVYVHPSTSSLHSAYIYIDGAISSSTGIYANFISANSTNLSTGGASNLSDLTINANKDWQGYGISNLDYISSQAISSTSIKTNQFTLGIGSPSSQFHMKHSGGAAFGKETMTGASRGFVNIEFTEDDDTNFIQGLKIHLKKDSVGGGSLYGLNATVTGNNTRNVGIYGYANGATTNYGLWIAKGDSRFDDNIYVKGTVSSQALSSQAISGGHITTAYVATADNDVVNKKYFDDNGAAVSLGGSLESNIGSDGTYGLSGIAFVSSSTISGGTYIGGLHHPADYIIYKKSSTYYCIAGATGILQTSGLDAADVIQNAIDAAPSTLIYVADNIELTKTVSGQARRRLDFGNHTIMCNGITGSGNKAFKMHAAFQVVNARIDAGLTNSFSGATVFSFHGADRFGTGAYWWERGTLVSNIQLYGLDSSGTAIKLYCDAANSEVGFCTFNDICIFGFKYGIHMDCRAESGEGTAWINGNRFHNIILEGSDYGIYMNRTVGNTYPEMAGNIFDNIKMETASNTIRLIRVMGDKNQFSDVTTWDKTLSDSRPLIEFTSDANKVYYRGWLGSATFWSNSGSNSNLIDTDLGVTSFSRVCGDSSGNRTYSDEGGLLKGNGLYLYGSPKTYLNNYHAPSIHIPACNSSTDSIRLRTVTTLPIYFQRNTSGDNFYNILRVNRSATSHGGMTVIKGMDNAGSGLKLIANNSDTYPYLYLDSNDPIDGDVFVVSSTTAKFSADNFITKCISSQRISGQYTTPIYRGAGKPVASVSNEGQIIRTSGAAGEKTYVWMSVKNDADTYEWIQLGMST